MGHFDKTLGYAGICSQTSYHGGCTGINEKPVKDWVWGPIHVGNTPYKMGLL